jgi:hypothetical protein
MPYKFIYEKKYIPEKKDKRVKLTKSQKEEIYILYNLYGAYSQRELATMYGVSKRLITFIVDPEKLKKNYENRLEKGGSKIYYNKDKHTEAIRKHRRYKQELNLRDELVDEKD